LANQRIGFLRFAACADSQGVWTLAADQHAGLDNGYFDRGKIALPDGAAADAASVDIVIVDGTAEFVRGL
jgi:hypothetical protein